MKYSKHTIIQSSHLKVQLEKLEIKWGDVTIASLDIVNMYPSVKYKLIKKAIEYYSQGFDEEERMMIESALAMMKFSMANTLVQFREKYYEYGVEEDPMERPLTIGGYDSAFYADLVGSYILELAKDKFRSTRFFGIYRDDGNLVFEGDKSTEELKDWLFDFQAEVNRITDSDDLQFTMDIWKPGEQSRELVPKKMNVIGEESFPYLDMKMEYDENRKLSFGMYSKPGFQTKYLNSGSCHTIACKRAIVRGTSIRLAGLTTITEENKSKSLSEIYPATDQALRKAGYLKTDKLPKLKKIVDNRMREIIEADLRKEERKKDRRNVYCITRFSGHWRTPIHKTIQRLRKKYGLG